MPALCSCLGSRPCFSGHILLSSCCLTPPSKHVSNNGQQQVNWHRDIRHASDSFIAYPGKKAQCSCQKLRTQFSECSEGLARQGFTTCEDFCSNFSKAGWQSDCVQAVALRERMHMQGMNSRVGNVHLSERFTALECPISPPSSTCWMPLAKKHPAGLQPVGWLA